MPGIAYLLLGLIIGWTGIGYLIWRNYGRR